MQYNALSVMRKKTLKCPFPLGFRRGGPSHSHGQHAQKWVKIAHVVPEISSRTDRHTDTDVLITIHFATAPAREVIIGLHIGKGVDLYRA